jgi:predicted nucleic acid-binding protein
MAARDRRIGIVYLDSSALVKLVVSEPESTALRKFLRRRPRRVSCALARTEVVRAVRHLGTKVTGRARQVVHRIDLVRLDDALLDAAALLDASVLRSLDAIHLTSAQSLGSELEAIVTYDARMAAGAEILGLPVVVPA